jgi:hypothetical protein
MDKNSLLSELSDNFFKQQPRLLVLALLLILFGWAPLLYYSDMVGPQDWTLFLHFNEAIRKSIAEYGQFPFWNPWHFGGTPLFARPQAAIFALETPCILLFGTIRGLSVASIIYVLAGSCGMWLLLGDLCEKPSSRFWGMVLFGLQGALSIHLAMGHIVMTTIIWLPWLVWSSRRITKSLQAALLFGVLSAMMMNQVLHYLTVIVSTVIGCFLVYEFWRNRVQKSFYLNMIAATLAFVTFCIYRVIVTWDFFRQFPRVMDVRAQIPLAQFLRALVVPGQHGFSWLIKPKPFFWEWHEIGSYVGAIAVIMFIVSYSKKMRWWHWGFIITLPLTLDSETIYLPGYWLRELPLYDTMFAITRWRFVTVFFLIIGSCLGIEMLFADPRFKRYVKWGVPVLLAISCAGLIYNSWYCFIKTEWKTKAEIMAGVPMQSDTIVTSNQEQYNAYAATAKGVDLLFTYEPLLGYTFNYQSKRVSVEQGNIYQGEIVALNKSLKAVNWTPNLIRLETGKPDRIFINQNPGSYWRSDGKRLFPGTRSFETMKMFIYEAPEPGTQVISAVPPLHEIALTINLIFGILLLAYLSWLRRFGRVPSLNIGFRKKRNYAKH